MITDDSSFTTLIEAFQANSIWGVLVYVVIAIGLWMVFSKAGLPGWLAVIPLVNVFVLPKVGGWSAWMGILLIIPIVGFFTYLVLSFKIGRNFGKGGVFSFFLIFLFSVIGFLILGFGSAKYQKV